MPVPDITPLLMNDEQLLWQGESHKEGPQPNPAASATVRTIGILWLIFPVSICFFILSRSPKGSMSRVITVAVILFALMFVAVGIALICSTFRFRHEYYFLTDKRFLTIDENGAVRSSGELFHAVSADITGVRDGYGSILIKTDIITRSYSRGKSHRHRTYWTIRGIADCADCFRILSALIQAYHGNNI